MDNSKEEEIADRLLKEKYLNEKNNNLLELAKNINSYTNAKNEDIIEEIDLKNILLKMKNNLESKNILKSKGLSLFEKMNILEENYKAIDPNKREINTYNYDSVIFNSLALDSYENYIFNNLYDSNDIIKKNYLCEIHNNKRFVAYCIYCNKNICSHCLEYTEMHKDHNISNFTKLILNKNEEEEYYLRLCSSLISLNKLKQIVLDICSELININEIILKNKVKRAYIKYYKQNVYQIEYAKYVYLRYILQNEISLLNYQILVNIFQIKFNSVIFNDTSKDIKEKAYLMIDFLSKTENYILLPSTSPHSNLAFDINFEKLKEIKRSMNRTSNLIKTLKENKENHNFIIKKRTSHNQIIYRPEKIPKNAIKNIIDKQNIFKSKINETKITTTTSIFVINSTIKSDNNNIIGKKKEKIIKKKITKKIIPNKIEKIEKGEQLFYEFSNFIDNYPPLNDGIEVELHKEIKFIYKDKIKNKIIYSIYQGECQKGTQIRHGRGYFKWGDGEKYIGYWVNNKREGQGINYYSNGNIYRGMFKNGKKEGKGRYEWKNGDIYEGDWKNGVKEGEGMYYCYNGDKYKGLFSNDQIHGQGTYTWKNESQYKGEFKNNYIEGVGILIKKIKENNNMIKKPIKIYPREKCLIQILD